jgi:hypothetical protein
MDVSISILCYPVLYVVRKPPRRRNEISADLVSSFSQPRLYEPKSLGNNALCIGVVLEVQRRGIHECEGERFGTVDVNIDGRSSNVGGVATASLYKPRDGLELVFGGTLGDLAGVDQQAEERAFTCDPNPGLT